MWIVMHDQPRHDEYSSENMKGDMPVNSQDLPMIPFHIVQEATKNFSNEAKLGEGGFGPVYKVISVIGLITKSIPVHNNDTWNSLCSYLQYNTHTQKRPISIAILVFIVPY